MLESAMRPMNSKNCVARRIVYGTDPAFTASSWATFARKYPLSGSRSVPTTDSTTWCATPAAASAARTLRDEVWKKSSTAASSQAGAFATSTTTWAPSSASASPSPVRVFTPVSGDAGDGLVAGLVQLLDELRPDQAGAADDDDLHPVSFHSSRSDPSWSRSVGSENGAAA